MAKAIIKATKSPLFTFMVGLIIVAAVGFVLLPSDSEAGVGSIWTTNGDCGNESQDVNHYDVGGVVYVNGRGFEANTEYSWFIKGKPGSSDPNQTVASGNYTTDAAGSFCFQAYTVQSGDEGVYSVKFGNKNDNYIVSDTMGAITIRKEGSKVCSMYTDFETYLKNGSGEIIHDGRVNDSYSLGFNQEITTMLAPGTYRTGEIHYENQYNWSIDCDANFTQYNTNIGHEAEVNLQAGQHITCTYTNTERTDNGGVHTLYAVAKDGNNNNVTGACYAVDFLDLLNPPGGIDKCPNGTLSGIGMCDGAMFGGQQIENPDGIVMLTNTYPDCDYRIRMVTVPAGYVSPVDPLIIRNPIPTDVCRYDAAFVLEPKYATINVHKNVLGSAGGDIVDYTNFTARVNGENKTFYEGSPATYTIIAKTTDVKEVGAETNPDFVFEGCTIDTGHTIETITNGIKILNIQEDDVINVTCTNRYKTSCGDGTIQTPNERGDNEQCDDGAQNTDFACSVRYGGNDCTYCTTSCEEITIKAPQCGDGTKQETEEECDDGNNTDGDGCSATCTIEYSQLTGRKYHDKNADGVHYKDSNPNLDETRLDGWLIRLYDDQWNQLKEVLTGHTGELGQFKFDNLEMGTYYICELIPMSQTVWTQTGPVLGSYPVDFTGTQVNDATAVANSSSNPNTNQEFPVCWEVNITTGGTDYGWLKFGNYYTECGNGVQDQGEECGEPGLTTPDHYTCNQCMLDYLPYCGDNEINQRTEECDGTAGVPEYYACTDSCALVYVPYCGDGNLDDNEECDGTVGITEHYTCTDQCQLEYIPYCGDGNIDPEEECDGTEGCTGTCTLETIKQIELAPLVTLDKLCTPNPVGAGENITYTLNWAVENVGIDNVVLTDEIPADTSFVSASAPGVYDAVTNTVTWDVGTAAPGNYLTTLVVAVDSPLANGTVIANEAMLNATEFVEVVGTCDVTVSSGPILTVEKLVDETTVNPGQAINYTVKVTNSGTDTAYRVRMVDTLPEGFTLADDNSVKVKHVFGDIPAGDSVAYTFAVIVGLDVTAGNYVNVVTVGADNYVELQAGVDLDVIVPLVLGEKIEAPVVLGESTELPVTGANNILALAGILTALTGAGAVTRWQIRKILR
ncbi:NEW3 domain-containing protein [Patescibacteria group bacterium]